MDKELESNFILKDANDSDIEIEFQRNVLKNDIKGLFEITFYFNSQYFFYGFDSEYLVSLDI